MNQFIKVIVADDHSLVRQGIISLLEVEKDIIVVAETDNGKDLVKKCLEHKPDVILSDLEMPGKKGTEVLVEVRKKFKEAKFLFLSMHYSDEIIYRIHRLNGFGLVSKSALKNELITAIRIVHSGEIYFQKINEGNLQKIIEKFKNTENRTPEILISTLTDKEKEVLLLIGEGLESKEIAKRLNSTERTISTHRSKIVNKLNIRTLPKLIKFTIENYDILKIS